MGEGAVEAPFLHAPARPLLAGALLLRACVNGAFAVWVLAYSPGWVEVFHGGAVYAIADGVVGFLMVGLIGWIVPIGAPATLVAVTSIDALLRLAAGAAILAFPGIPEISITLVLFYGIVGVWAASAGTIAIVAWLAVHAHAHATARPRSVTRTMFDPLSAEGVVALVLAAYALIVGPPATVEALRVAGAVATGSFAVLFLIAAAGVARRRFPAP